MPQSFKMWTREVKNKVVCQIIYKMSDSCVFYLRFITILSINGENTIDIPIEIIDPSQAKQPTEKIEEAGNLFLFAISANPKFPTI